MSHGDAFDPVDVALRDGRRVTVRAIHERDAAKLQGAIRALSVESRYSRFFSPLRELPPELLERATHPDPGRELQLVAVVADGGQETIVAGARYAALPERGACEFAVAIVDDWQSQGLARRLLDADRARTHQGFRHMDGYVLATNTAMLGLARRLGFTETASTEGPTIRTVRRNLHAKP